jgi:pimeloyl-ACP methyl ester carboxylesterase
VISTREILLRDGLRAAVHVTEGAAFGRTVVFCHSAPGAGAFDPDPTTTSARGITLIGVDRPGYGGSDPLPDASWADVGTVADDLAEILDHMGTGSVGLAGWSAGGRVALAVAARRPDLVDRVVVVATPAPDDAVPWILPEQKAALDALRDQPAAVVHAALTAQLSGVVTSSARPAPRGRLALLGVGDADDQALAMPGGDERLTAMLDTAFAQGPIGLVSDLAGYCLRPWGFDVADVRAKTLLLNGSADPIAGPRHGKWWQRWLSDARYEQVPGAGHLVIMPMWGRALAHLAPRRR